VVEAKKLVQMVEVTNSKYSTQYSIRHVACRAKRDVEDACLLTPVQESAQLVGG
jgi:hypothetical protein